MQRKLGIAWAACWAAFCVAPVGVEAQRPQLAAPADPPAIGARLAYARDLGAERCADAATVQEGVSRQLGYAVFERTPITRRVQVHIASAHRGLHAHIDVRSETGEPLGAREIDSTSADCEALSSALTLAIAIALDPDRLLAPSEPIAPSASSTPLASSAAAVAALACPAPPACPRCAVLQPDPSTSAALPVQPRASSFLGFGLGVGIGGGIGVLPALSAAGLVEASATWTAASAQLAAVLHPGARGGELRGPNAAIDDPVAAELLQAELTICGRLALAEAWAFDACALGSVGALRGSATTNGERDASLAAAIGAQARLERRLLGPWFAQARVELQANLVRTTLNLGGASAWTTPPFWSVLSLVTGLHFW